MYRGLGHPEADIQAIDNKVRRVVGLNIPHNQGIGVLSWDEQSPRNIFRCIRRRRSRLDDWVFGDNNLERRGVQEGGPFWTSLTFVSF